MARLSGEALRLAAVAAGATIAVAVVSGREVGVVILGDGPTRVARLGPTARLIALVSAARADLAARAALGPGHPMGAPVAASLAARLFDLGQAVADPLAQTRGGLVVVPPRGLSGVPWLALPRFAGRSVTVAPPPPLGSPPAGCSMGQR